MERGASEVRPLAGQQKDAVRGNRDGAPHNGATESRALPHDEAMHQRPLGMLHTAQLRWWYHVEVASCDLRHEVLEGRHSTLDAYTQCLHDFVDVCDV